jgi:hypothetical protein
VKRWVESGVLFRVGDDEKLLHIYPLGKSDLKDATKPARRRGRKAPRARSRKRARGPRRVNR